MKWLNKLDPFLLLMGLSVLLATVLPVRGQGASMFSWITTAAVVMLFFLHGAKLSRQAVIAGIGHWRLHLLVAGSSYLLFPILGLLIRVASAGRINPTLTSGLLFVCLLPSTVQSSIAFTSIAKGNVPAAVCSATLSNLAGIVVTPLLVGLTLGGVAKGGGGLDLHAVISIASQLLLPFIAGHLSRPLTAGFLGRHKAIVGRVDRSSILLVVYGAFSAAVVGGIWRQMSVNDIAAVLALDGLLLSAVLIGTTMAARLLGFCKADEIAIVFCGSKKSMISGVPMASVLFPAALVGPVIVPLMLFHQMQLMVCAILARRYADRSSASLEAPIPA